jgi:hypothetical protein
MSFEFLDREENISEKFSVEGISNVRNLSELFSTILDMNSLFAFFGAIGDQITWDYLLFKSNRARNEFEQMETTRFSVRGQLIRRI